MSEAIQEKTLGAPASSPLSAGQDSTSNPAITKWHVVFAAALIIALNLLCFYRSISGYFLADDMLHIAWLSRVFDGHPELILKNFYSNWMDSAGTRFYRPFISVTLALDYALWGANAIGYHATNLLCQIASSIFLFLSSFQLLSAQSRQNARRAFWCALTAGCLFAVFPLHAEVVSWVIGRVDGVATAFYLAAFYFFLRATKPKVAQQPNSPGQYLNVPFVASLLCFAVALLSKEIAATLPIAVCAAMFALTKTRDEETWTAALRKSALVSFPFFAMLALYLAVRTLALGTAFGGYEGSIGEGLSQSLFKRWFEEGSFLRMLMPFNAELFSPADKLRNWLKIAYLSASIALVARVASSMLDVRANTGLPADAQAKLQEKRDKHWRLVIALALFGFLWLVASVLPAYQVFKLTETLQGSRFIYLATAPLCFLMALLVWPPVLGKRIFELVSAALSVVLVLLFANICIRDNIAWVHAGKQMKLLRQEVVDKVSALPGDEKLILLNLPQSCHGAHIIYNADTFGVALRPPLSPTDVSQRVITFEPMNFGDSDLILKSRFLSAAFGGPEVGASQVGRSDGHPAVYWWDSGSYSLKRLNLINSTALTAGTATGSIAGEASAGERHTAGIGFDKYSTELNGNNLAVSPACDISTLDVDTIEVRAQVTAGNGINLSWNTADNPSFTPERTLTRSVTNHNSIESYTFHVGERKRWLSCERIAQLAIGLGMPRGALHIESVRLIGHDNRTPLLSPSPAIVAERTMVADITGVSRPGQAIGPFNWDASNVPGARYATYEITRPNSWFEHYSETYRDTDFSKATLVKGRLPSLKGEGGAVSTSVLPGAGYYQIRIIATDKVNRPVGFASDPLNLQFSSADIVHQSQPPSERYLNLQTGGPH